MQTPWFRFHSLRRDPLFFGQTGDSRFDAPEKQFGVLYLGDSAQCAFIETFGRSTGENVVTLAALAQRCLSRLAFSRPLRLVDLTGAGLARLGADNRLCDGDHLVAQRWSFAFWVHPDQPDGVLYRARHDPSRVCAAIFDRSASAIAPVERLGSLIDPASQSLLAEILDTYQFGLISAL